MDCLFAHSILDMVSLVPKEEIKLLCEVGSGAFATVYKAEWNNTEVAVKIILQQTASYGMQLGYLQVKEMKKARNFFKRGDLGGLGSIYFLILFFLHSLKGSALNVSNILHESMQYEESIKEAEILVYVSPLALHLLTSSTELFAIQISSPF